MSAADDRIRQLYRERPRSRLRRVTGVVFAAVVVYAWFGGDFSVTELFHERRRANLERFVTEDLVPFPLKEQPFSLSGWWEWGLDHLQTRGLAAAARTLAISVVAIVMAAMIAALLTPFAARNLASATPFRPASRPEPWHWRWITRSARVTLVLLRSLPEYIWAFLFLAILGPNAWPVVLALAIHNTGILGKLSAETVENLSPPPLRAFHERGATRAQTAIHGVLPLALNRFLLYFFYRFETCIREATVLGMLGVVSLGYWIEETRSKHYYDEMMLYVILGSVLVLSGDLVSSLARGIIRRSS